MTIQSVGEHMEEMELSYIHIRIHTRMFPAASFVTCERWKQHKCASVGEWINETVYPYNRILLSNENK